MNVQWLGSPNFTPNRYGHTISKIILHTMVGSTGAANARFQQSSQQASAHYGVSLDGTIVQWVRDTDAAWHAGNFNINLDSIGIEHEDGGNYNGPRTPQLYQSSIDLVRELRTKYNVSQSQIFRHQQVSDLPTACPDALDTTRIITGSNTPAPTPTPIPTPIPIFEDHMIDVCSYPTGTRRDLIGIGRDGSIYHAVSSTGDLTNLDVSNGQIYESLGGAAIGGVHCQWLSANQFEVLVVGTDHNLYRNTYVPSGWSGWHQVGGTGSFGK